MNLTTIWGWFFVIICIALFDLKKVVPDPRPGWETAGEISGVARYLSQN